MAGCLSQAWIASIVDDLRVAVAAKGPESPGLVPHAAGCESGPVSDTTSCGPLLDCLRSVVEERRSAEDETESLKNNRAWQAWFHSAMADILREDYGEPVPQRHGPFVPEKFTGDILALTRGMF